MWRFRSEAQRILDQAGHFPKLLTQRNFSLFLVWKNLGVPRQTLEGSFGFTVPWGNLQCRLSDPESGAHVAAELGELYGRAPTEEVPLGTACETILGVSEIYGNIGKMGGKFRLATCSGCSGCWWTMIHISKICLMNSACCNTDVEDVTQLWNERNADCKQPLQISWNEEHGSGWVLIFTVDISRTVTVPPKISQHDKIILSPYC